MTEPTTRTEEPSTPSTTPAGPPPPSDHDRTARVVATVVALVLVAGLVGGLLGGAKRDHRLPQVDETSVLQTPPTTVSPPTTVPLPGPQPGDDGVTGSGPGKAVHVVGQVDPPASDGDLQPSTGGDEPADGPSEGDGPRLADDSGDRFEVPGGYQLAIPADWEYHGNGEGHDFIIGDGAFISVSAYHLSGGAGLADVIETETSYIGDDSAELRYADIRETPTAVDHVVAAGTRRYQAVTATQDGTTVVDGLIAGIVLDDDTAYTVTLTTREGELADHSPELGLVLRSLFDAVSGEEGGS